MRPRTVIGSALLWAGALASGCGFDPPEVTGEPPGDGQVLGGVCDVAVDDHDIALYTFDDGSVVTIADRQQRFNGAVVGGGALAIPSIDGCGMALQFPATGTTYVEIPDRPEFHLDEGSIELLVRTSDFSALRGILSRDAAGSGQSGHLTLYEVVQGRIVLRVQDGGDMFLCSNQVFEPGTWVHVVINIGDPVELYLDGEKAASLEPVAVPANGVCGESRAMSIAGNGNPWTLGGSQDMSDEGAATPFTGQFRDGAVDHLRIRDTRRAVPNE